MTTLHQRFSVTYEYPVHFTRDVFSPENPLLAEALCRVERRRHRVMPVLDRGVAEAWPSLRARMAAYAQRWSEQLQWACEPLLVEGGEACKSAPEAPRSLLAQMDALHLDRQSFVLAVGGGAVLDLVGLAAALAHRGVRLVRLPTTVLAQADAGLGVKNGVNAFGKKNAVGTFAPPFAVLNDADFLQTLEPRDRRAGMAEAVKVALIRDAAFLGWMVEHAGALAAGEAEALGTLVQRSAELHLAHIATSGDPFELGSARPLDFGHWAAHKLESLTGHRLRHGEAVAIGLALDTAYSVECGLLAPAVRDRVVALLRALGFRLWDTALASPGGGRHVLLEGLAEFREHLGGELTVTLLAAPGRGVEVHEMDERLVLCALAWLEAREAEP